MEKQIPLNLGDNIFELYKIHGIDVILVAKTPIIIMPNGDVEEVEEDMKKEEKV